MEKMGNMANDGLIRRPFQPHRPSPPRQKVRPADPGSPARLEFLIANLELESLLNHGKSTQYKFLIANILRFLISVSLARLVF